MLKNITPCLFLYLLVALTQKIQAQSVITNVSFVGTKISVNETANVVNIVANLQGGGSIPSSIDIEILPINMATAGNDFIAPASLQFNWGATCLQECIPCDILIKIISSLLHFHIQSVTFVKQ
ncbi:MAG: hypothetical protein WKF97_13755 [Chitinophagaceae bacterium]